jgi:SulP family sulfate permease
MDWKGCYLRFPCRYFQILFGLFKLGKVSNTFHCCHIRITSGIGAIILIGQIPKPGYGYPCKGYAWETVVAIIENLSAANYTALLICIATIILLLYLPAILVKIKYLNSLPASIVALILSVLLIYYMEIDIPIVGSIPLVFLLYR